MTTNSLSAISTRHNNYCRMIFCTVYNVIMNPHYRNAFKQHHSVQAHLTGYHYIKNIKTIML